jgi:hypothetical protein
VHDTRSAVFGFSCETAAPFRERTCARMRHPIMPAHTRHTQIIRTRTHNTHTKKNNLSVAFTYAAAPKDMFNFCTCSERGGRCQKRLKLKRHERAALGQRGCQLTMQQPGPTGGGGSGLRSQICRRSTTTTPTLSIVPDLRAVSTSFRAAFCALPSLYTCTPHPPSQPCRSDDRDDAEYKHTCTPVLPLSRRVL